MDNRRFESGASATPPTPPAAPSLGYPTNGNPVGPIPATEPGDFWFHQIGEELRAIITAAGIAPDHANLTQILTALRSAGVFQTAPQFDTSTKVATMAAVQRALGGLRGTVQETVAVQLTVDTAGMLHVLNQSAGAYSVTLPFLADAGAGSAYHFVNQSGVTLQLSARGTEQLLISSSAPAQSVTMLPGESMSAFKYGGWWVVIITGSTGVGCGQTWQSVLGSRSLSVTYTNTTGRPMKVIASATNTMTNSTLTIALIVGGVMICAQSDYSSSGVGQTELSVAGIVPPGATYSVVGTQINLSHWAELR